MTKPNLETMNDTTQKMTVATVLFEGFELLDVFGPLEMFGVLSENFNIVMLGEEKGLVASHQGPKVLAEESIYSYTTNDILLIPGGMGTRREVDNDRLIEALREHVKPARHVLTVCTGAALLAKTGLLDGLKATSNKQAFEWVKEQGKNVNWVATARWVEDGKFFTSSGVSAGMDMALGFIGKLLGKESSTKAAIFSEYEWNSDPSQDPFGK